jgi:GNAT superfamily N-acetyltransferase
LSPPRPASPLARCHRNYAEAFWQYTKPSPGSQRRTIGGGIAMRSSLASPYANPWFLIDPEGPLDPVFAEATSFYGADWPFRVLSDGTRSAEVGNMAVARGLRPTNAEPGMLLDPIPAAPAPPAGLSIRTVASPADLHDFEPVWCEAFGIPRFLFPLLLPSVLVDDPERGAQNRMFTGYVGGRPVATSSLVLTERVAGVVSVGTARTARGHGYGTALTWHAVQEGQRLGADVAYLAATSMGFPVYEKMGFRKVAEYPAWAVRSGFFRQIRNFWGMWRLARSVRGRSASP